MSGTETTYKTDAYIRWIGPLMVLAGGVFIGMAPIGLRLGLSELGPQAIAFWRYVLALPVLLGLVFAIRRSPPRKPNRFVVIAGICFALDIALWHWALTYTSVANATFIVNIGTIATGFVAWLILRERPTMVWAVAVAMALSGVATLSLGSLRGPGTAHEQGLYGDVLALGAAVMVAFYLLFSKLARRRLSGIETIFWLTCVEALVAGAIVLVSGEAWFPATLQGWLVPLFLALFAHIAGQGLIVAGLGHTPAGIAGVLIVIQPVVAALLSWQLFGEVLTALQIGGCMLIVGAILLAQTRRAPGIAKVSDSGVKPASG